MFGVFKGGLLAAVYVMGMCGKVFVPEREPLLYGKCVNAYEDCLPSASPEACAERVRQRLVAKNCEWFFKA